MLPVRTSRGSDFEQAYASPVIVEAKGADEESLRRHERKRDLPRALNDEAGTLKDGRNRRSRGCGDDEGKITPDGLHNEDLLVGGPYLCSFPRDLWSLCSASGPLSAALDRQLPSGQTLWSEIFLILEKHPVMSPAINFEYHRSYNDPEPKRVPTLSILSTREQVNDDWLSCVREIRSLLCCEGLAELNVEIVDEHAFTPSITFPILQRDPIHGRWDEVLSRILAHMDLSDVDGVGCYRRGSSKNTRESAPTVLIIVNVSSERDWRDVRDFAVDVLDEFDLPMVAVEIVKDRPMERMTDSESWHDHQSLLDGKARAAGPLSHESEDSRSGTLGGFVSFREDESKPLRRYALTCFHCVDPDDKHLKKDQIQILKQWRELGIVRSKAKDGFTLRVNHPSTKSIQEKIATYTNMITQYNCKEFYQVGLEYKREGIFDEVLPRSEKHNWELAHKTVTDAEEFIAKLRKFQQDSRHVLGEVTHASRYRLKDLHTLGEKQYPTSLDWALISISQERPVSNFVDDKWIRFDEFASPMVLSEMENSKVTSVSEGDDPEMKSCSLYGWRSGRSDGYYTGSKMARIVDKPGAENNEREVTLEYTIIPPGFQTFCQPGDSGSLIVLGMCGPVVGMLTGGFKHLRLGYFTRIDDLLGDIMSQVSTSEIKFTVDWDIFD